MVTKPSERAKRLRNETTDEHSSSIASRSIQGDLDAIVLKALAKEPQRRYRSAEQLSENLIRYRDSLPVSARQGTQSYRARKFFQRNRVPLTATAAVFIVLVAAIFLLLEQQKLLIHQRNRAETVADWMVGLFELSDPAYALGQEVTVRQVLDNSSKTIREELGHDPRLLHQMPSVLGQTYFNIGRSDEARKLTTDALDIAEQFGSIEDKLDNLLLLSRIANRQGHGQEAYELADQALALARETLPSTDAKVVTEALIAKGLSAGTSFRPDEAILELYEEAQRLATETGDLETLAKALFLSGGILSKLEKHSVGKERVRRALEIRQDILPENHPDLLMNQVVLTAMSTRKPTEMPRLMQELERFRQVISQDSERLVATLHSAAQATLEAELLDESRELFEEILEISTVAWGAEHHYAMSALGQIAQILFRQGDLIESEAMYKKTLAMYLEQRGKNNDQVAIILGQLALIDIHHRQLDSAEKRLLESLSTLEELGNEHRNMMIMLANLGTVQKRKGRLDSARDFYQQAIVEGRKLEGFSLELTASLYNLAELEKQLGLIEDSLNTYLEVWEHAQDDSSLGPTALCRAASLEIRRNNLDAAQGYIDRCDESSKPWLQDSFLRTYPGYLQGSVWVRRQQFPEAIAILEENLKLRQQLEVAQILIDETNELLDRARAGLAKSTADS